MISRVFSEREKTEIDAAIEAFEEALLALERQKQTLPNKKAAAPDQQKTLERIELQRQRIGQLLDLAKLGKKLLDALLSTAKVDAEPLTRFLLGRSR
jgi:transcriptional regulator of aromatic amino acid metabolism